jgi:hypothetical protein
MTGSEPSFWEAATTILSLALFGLNAMLWWVTKKAAKAAEKSANAAHRQANIAAENLELLRQQIKPMLVVETATPRLQRGRPPEVALSVYNAGATLAGQVEIAGDVYFAPPNDRQPRELTQYPSLVNIAPGQKMSVGIGGEANYGQEQTGAYTRGDLHLYATGTLTYVGPDGRQSILRFKFHNSRPERPTMALSHDGNDAL